jgi:hypothetical protein
MHVVKFPQIPISDLAEQLRKLADEVESGDYVAVAWVTQTSDGEIDLGLIGSTPAPAEKAHLMFAQAMNRIQS